MINLDITVQNAASALLKGDWVAYQRYLRSVPSTKETEFMRRVDVAVKSSKGR
ncbi:hypothetical protein [Crocosphaera sp. Alani8]|uniref:hypothetical protein n=1 Tax=Crocosphaera sp. Alani8 TaxID=3038952 RepID=UPI00313DABC5